jgi:peptidoglycan/LPS O-acetylase OafA/YrhL
MAARRTVRDGRKPLRIGAQEYATTESATGPVEMRGNPGRTRSAYDCFSCPKMWWDRLAVRPSWTGVDLFFVISGFLISGLLFSEFKKHGRINFGGFAIRRALKNYPTLYALVFGVMVIRLIHSGFRDVSWIIEPVLHDIFFVQSYLRGTYGHFWSLAVEEHFYIILPLMLYFMLRRARAGETDPFRALPLIFLLVAIFSVGARLCQAVLVQPFSYTAHFFLTHLRLDSLFFLALLSYWYRFHTKRFNALINRVRPFLIPISLVLIMPAFILEQSSPFTYTVGFSALYLGYGGLMISFLQVPLTTKCASGRLLMLFSYIGQHSYSIYLFHILVLEQLLKRGLLQTWRGLVLYFISSIAVGILLSKVIEFPVLHLRDRIFPPDAEALPAYVRQLTPQSLMTISLHHEKER